MSQFALSYSLLLLTKLLLLPKLARQMEKKIMSSLMFRPVSLFFLGQTLGFHRGHDP